MIAQNFYFNLYLHYNNQCIGYAESLEFYSLYFVNTYSCFDLITKWIKLIADAKIFDSIKQLIELFLLIEYKLIFSFVTILIK